MDAHYCSACGESHGGRQGESDEVKVAKINADRDIEVARLARAEARQEIEAEIEQTEIIADAAVEEAVVEAAVLDDILNPEPEAAAEPEPTVVEIPDAEPEPETVPGPAELEEGPAETKKTGVWDSYR
jgi:hypothetical protein